MIFALKMMAFHLRWWIWLLKWWILYLKTMDFGRCGPRVRWGAISQCDFTISQSSRSFFISYFEESSFFVHFGRFQWKNANFLFKNPDFLLKNLHFIIKQESERYVVTVVGVAKKKRLKEVIVHQKWWILVPENDEFCPTNDELGTTNDEFCTENDEY